MSDLMEWLNNLAKDVVVVTATQANRPWGYTPQCYCPECRGPVIDFVIVDYIDKLG